MITPHTHIHYSLSWYTNTKNYVLWRCVLDANGYREVTRTFNGYWIWNLLQQVKNETHTWPKAAIFLFSFIHSQNCLGLKASLMLYCHREITNTTNGQMKQSLWTLHDQQHKFIRLLVVTMQVFLQMQIRYISILLNTSKMHDSHVLSSGMCAYKEMESAKLNLRSRRSLMSANSIDQMIWLNSLNITCTCNVGSVTADGGQL